MLPLQVLYVSLKWCVNAYKSLNNFTKALRSSKIIYTDKNNCFGCQPTIVFKRYRSNDLNNNGGCPNDGIFHLYGLSTKTVTV
ncbi:hypothetical protein B9T35_08255 [Acinetobacter sp. ANC 3832]|nr:hypothetical protein B9T35_08255 [Acinetobacter sp. ANC 3832]